MPWHRHRYRIFVHGVRITSGLRIRPKLCPATGRRAVGEYCKALLFWKRRGSCEYPRLHRTAYRRRRVDGSDRRRVNVHPCVGFGCGRGVEARSERSSRMHVKGMNTLLPDGEPRSNVIPTQFCWSTFMRCVRHQSYIVLNQAAKISLVDTVASISVSEAFIPFVSCVS